MSSVIDESMEDKLKKVGMATKLAKELGIPTVMLLILSVLFVISAKWVGEKILLPLIEENRESSKLLRENSNQQQKSFDKLAVSQEVTAKSMQEMSQSIKTMADDSAKNSRNIETILQDIKGMKK